MLKRKSFAIFIIIVALVGVGLYMYGQNKSNRSETKTTDKTVLSATDVLENADFNEKDSSVNIESVTLKPNKFTPIEIPEETQQKLIRAFKKAKFKKVDDLSEINYRYNYHIKIVLNGGYDMIADSTKKFIQMDDTGESYVMENDNGFFDILENAINK